MPVRKSPMRLYFEALNEMERAIHECEPQWYIDELADAVHQTLHNIPDPKPVANCPQPGDDA